MTRLKKSSILSRIERFRTVTPSWIHQWVRNDAQSLKKHRRGALLFCKVIRQISRSHGSKNRRIWTRLGVSGLYFQFEFTSGYEMLHKAWSSIEEVPYCFPSSSIKFLGHRDNISPILTRIERFWTVNPVWIHQWLWNDAQSLAWYRRSALLFFKVINPISVTRAEKLTISIQFDIIRPVAAIKFLRFALFRQ